MAAKKDDITTYTKVELIKALRASVAREAKLQKRITKLEGASTAVNPELHTDDPHPYGISERAQRVVERLENVALPHGGPYTVTTIDRAEAEALAIRNAAAAELDRRAKLPGIGPCKLYEEDSSMVGPDDEDLPPAFPWEPK